MHNFRTRLENLMHRNERRGVLSEDDKLKQISSRARARSPSLCVHVHDICVYDICQAVHVVSREL